jgi:multiple sugar transport system permease protein
MSAIAARRRAIPRRLPELVTRVLAVAVAAAFLYPLVLMVVESLRPPGVSRHGAFTPGLEAWRQAFDWVPLGHSLLNSLAVAALYVPLTLAVASMAGVGMALLSRGRQAVLLTALLLVASIPLTAVWIPRFVMFEAVGAVGTWVPLVAPALAGGSPLFVLLFFLAARRLPPDLLDAARLEGVSALGLWWRVALPLLRPTTFAVGLLAAAQTWGNFMEATLYLKSEAHLTAPLMLHSLELMGSTQWPVLMAGATAVTLPVVLACLALQRLFAAPEREGPWYGR